MSAEPKPPSESVPFALAGFRGETLRGAERAVHTGLLPDPMKRAREGIALREAMSRLTSRVVWEGVGPVLLKVHRTRSLGERLLSLVRRGRARAEWDAARFLTAAGMSVPGPLAFGEQRRAGLLHTSFYAARFLEGMRTVLEALPEQEAGKRVLLHERTALLVRGLHDLGFDHRDLHAGNVMCGPGPGEACRLVITDLHRSSFGGEVGTTARRRGVAQWLYSLREELAAPGRRAWLRTYLAGDPGLEAWCTEVEARMARLERRRRRSRGKRCLVESTVYTRDIGAGWGARRRDLSLERLERVLAAHAAGREPGRPGFLRTSRKGVVTLHGDIVVKERYDERPIHRLRDRVLPKRHANGYRNAHMLGVLGAGTAVPLAYVRRAGRSYTLYENIGHLTRLDHRARGVYRSSDRALQVRLREASAAWLGGLHREGIYHGDLKGVHVLVGPIGEGFEFKLIDTDHMRFETGAVLPRRRIKNLAQLAASISTRVTRTERLRWYRRYLVAAGVREDERAAARSVADGLARKIVVVDEPIE